MNAFTFAAAWTMALASAPRDCALVLEANSHGSLSAAMYRRLTEDGPVNAFYATGRTEVDALAGLVAKVRGEAVAV